MSTIDDRSDAHEGDDATPGEWGAVSRGFLVALPLFLAYEWGRFHAQDAGFSAARNTAEVLVTRLLDLAAPGAPWLRLALLGALALVALWRVLGKEDDVPRAMRRDLFWGLVAALCFGPLLFATVGLAEVSASDLARVPAARLARPSGAGPTLTLGLSLFGSAAWEELVFRVGAYGIVFLGAVRVLRFFALPGRVAVVLAELAAMLISSVLFAAYHLDVFTRHLGVGGQPFESFPFLWRILAGLFLAALFRWRGLGTAAWAHGLFNLGLLLGASPGVLG